MANRTVSLYIRYKGKNFRAAPTVPDLTAIYYLRYYDGPKQHWQKVGSYAFVQRAKLLLERRLSATAQGFILPEDEGQGAVRTTLREAVETYLAEVKIQRREHTHSGYLHTLNQFMSAVHVHFLHEVKRQQVLEYVAWLRKQEHAYSDRTIFNKVLTVAVFLKAAGVPKLLRNGDWPRYEEKKPVGYTPNEISAIKAVATSEELDLLISALDTGFRKGALSNLRWVDVDFANRTVTTQASGNWRTKNDKAIMIGLTNRLYGRLQARYATRQSQPLHFPGPSRRAQGPH
jgi:integrase